MALKLSPVGLNQLSAVPPMPTKSLIEILKYCGPVCQRQQLGQATPEQRGYQNHMQEGCCQRPLLMQIWCSSRKYFSNKYLENIIKQMQLIIGL